MGMDMESSKIEHIHKRMLLMIPASILFMIGDYAMGIEPKNSVAVSGMISSGWLTIADWRIIVSNIGGLFGSILYAAAALPFLEYLNHRLTMLTNKADRGILKIYMAGLVLGIMSFMYFHIACGTLIHNYNVIFDAAGGNTELAVEMWNRSYSVQAFCYWATFIAFGIAVTGGWIAIVLRGILPLKKVWFLAAPLMVAGIGFLLEAILPLPFNGLSSGFESFGWMVMFLGGIKCLEETGKR